MKSYIKELSSDYLLDGSSGVSQSETILGVTSLTKDEPDKALQLFESALSKNHKVPAAWLGKAYAEAQLSSPERDFAESIQMSIQHCFELCTDEKLIVRHYSAILSIVVERNAKMVQKHIEQAERARQKEAEEKKKAAWSAVAAGAALGTALGSKNNKWKAVAGVGTVGAGAKAVHHEEQTIKLNKLQDDFYGLAMSYCLSSAACTRKAIQVSRHAPQKAASSLQAHISEWKKAAAALLNKELEQLEDFLKAQKSTFKRYEGFKEIILQNGRLEEVDQVASYCQLLGLQNHSITEELISANERIEDMASDEELISNNDQMHNYRLVAYWSPFLLVAFISYLDISLPPIAESLLAWLMIVAPLVAYNFGQSRLQKEVIKLAKTLSGELSSVSVSPDDLELFSDRRQEPQQRQSTSEQNVQVEQTKVLPAAG